MSEQVKTNFWAKVRGFVSGHPLPRGGLAWLCVLVFAFASAASTAYWKTSVQQIPRQDEALYYSSIEKTRQIIEKHKPGSGLTALLNEYYEDSDIAHGHPPGFRMMGGYLLHKKILTLDKLHLINCFAQLISVIFVYLIASMLFGRSTGLWSAAIWACLPLNVIMSRIVLIESFLVAPALVAAWLALVFLRTKLAPMMILLGLFIGAGMYFKQSFILYPIGILLFKAYDTYMPEALSSRGPSTFGLIFHGQYKFVTALFAAFLLMFIFFRASGSGEFGAYLEESINVLLTGLIFCILFDSVYRHSNRGNRGDWAIIFLVIFGAHAIFPLAKRPDFYGEHLHSFQGLLPNLLCDQSILINSILLFYFIAFVRADKVSFGQFTAGNVGGMLRRILSHFRFSERYFTLGFLFFMATALIVFAPYYTHFQHKGLLKYAIEKRGALPFAAQLFIPFSLILFTSFLHVGFGIFGFRKIAWGKNERMVLLWFLFPLLAYTFLFNNQEDKYFFPAFPAFAILLGRMMSSLSTADQRKRIPVVGAIALLLVYLACLSPTAFSRLPMRIVTLPMEHIRLYLSADMFSEKAKSDQINREIFKAIHAGGQWSESAKLVIDESVDKLSRICADSLNLMFLMETGKDAKPVFQGRDHEGMGIYHESQFAIVREGSRLAVPFKREFLDTGLAREVYRFSVYVTDGFAFFTAIIEGDWLHPEKYEIQNYVIYRH